MTKRILILLPRDRTRPGVLHLFGADGAQLEAVPCRGKADGARAAKEGNTAREPLKPYGDTPTGKYKRTRPTPTGDKAPKLGPIWIPLVGIEGDAVLAKAGGRTGLGIHAGRGNELIATYGCIRVGQNDFDDLVAAIGEDDVDVTIEELPAITSAE